MRWRSVPMATSWLAPTATASSSYGMSSVLPWLRSPWARQAHLPPPAPFNQALMYSGNGHMLVLLTGQGTVELWNVADPANPKRLRQLPTITTGLVNSVAFSPQGTLATDDEDGAIQLWTAANPANPQPFGQPIAISSLITSVTFRLDGTMAGGTSAGTIFLWDLHVNDAIKRICSTARGDLTAR